MKVTLFGPLRLTEIYGVGFQVRRLLHSRFQLLLLIVHIQLPRVQMKTATTASEAFQTMFHLLLTRLPVFSCQLLYCFLISDAKLPVMWLGIDFL